MTLSKFSGGTEEDVGLWVKEVNRWVGAQRIGGNKPEIQKICLVAQYLTGAARNWLDEQNIPFNDETLTYDDFVRKLIAQFPKDNDVRIDDLQKFWVYRQTNNQKTEDYVNQKARLARRARVTLQTEIDSTISGLCGDIRFHVMKPGVEITNTAQIVLLGSRVEKYERQRCIDEQEIVNRISAKILDLKYNRQASEFESTRTDLNDDRMRAGSINRGEGQRQQRRGAPAGQQGSTLYEASNGDFVGQQESTLYEASRGNVVGQQESTLNEASRENFFGQHGLTLNEASRGCVQGENYTRRPGSTLHEASMWGCAGQQKSTLHKASMRDVGGQRRSTLNEASRGSVQGERYMRRPESTLYEASREKFGRPVRRSVSFESYRDDPMNGSVCAISFDRGANRQPGRWGTNSRDDQRGRWGAESRDDQQGRWGAGSRDGYRGRMGAVNNQRGSRSSEPGHQNYDRYHHHLNNTVRNDNHHKDSFVNQMCNHNSLQCNSSAESLPCLNCGKFGHFEEDCKSKPKEVGPPQDFTSMIRVKINGKFNDVLVDTGANLSCVDADFAKSLGIEIRPSTIGSHNLISAACENMSIIGDVDLIIDVNGNLIRHVFRVIKPLSAKIICGTEFLKMYFANINYQDGTVNMKIANVLTSVPFVRKEDYIGRAFLIDKVVIQPRQEIVLPIRTNQRIESGDQMEAKPFGETHKHIRIIPTTFCTDNKHVRVKNESRSINLRKIA
jgi:Aspartyl protease